VGEHVVFLQNDFYQILPQYFTNYRAFIPIMTGCDNFCSYCVVPYARGREKSNSPEDILKRARKLAKSGYKELYLLGQNVNRYQGLDKKGKKWNFAKLLRSINKIPGKLWIRFISSHPKDITNEFISTFKNCRKVSSNLHLPLQSGSNKILRLMNRGYTREKYLETVGKIRQAYPETVLSTDIIVGFPGETEQDFQDSLDVVKKVGFEMLFALKYSPRPETASSKMKDNVSAQTKINRQRILDQTWKKIAQKKNKRFLGHEVEILIDKVKTKANTKGKVEYFVLGKTFENKDVEAKTPKGRGSGLLGKWGSVRIEETGALALKGRIQYNTKSQFQITNNK